MADGQVVEQAITKTQREPLGFMPKNLDEMWRLAEMISKSALAPPVLVGKPYDVQLVLMTGWELGLSATQSLRDIDIVKGRPYMRALLKVALVKQSPLCEYFKLIESTDKKAVYETERKGEGKTRFEYTFEDAQRAGVIDRKDRDGKVMTDDVWAKWLRLMLRRRCSSQLADEVYPDVCRGIGDREDMPTEKTVVGSHTVLQSVAPVPSGHLQVVEAASAIDPNEEREPEADAPPESSPAPKMGATVDDLLARINKAAVGEMNALSDEVAGIRDMEANTLLQQAWIRRHKELKKASK